MFSAKRKELLESKEAYLVVKVHPGATSTQVRGVMDDGVFKIDIVAAPEKNRANKELIKYLATEFKVEKERVKIISGAGGRMKMVKIIN